MELDYYEYDSPRKKNPKMKLKAAEMRRLMKCVHYLIPNFFPVRNGHEQLVFDCLDRVHSVYAELDTWDSFASPSEGGARCPSIRHVIWRTE